MSDSFERLLGPRPALTLDIEAGFVTALWIGGRCPDLILRDYDLGRTDRNAPRDFFGAPYFEVRWRLPPWQLGLALAPRSRFPF